MRITVDTNILLRSAVRDDPQQAEVADRVLRGSALVAVTLPCLCEFVWVLRSSYGFSAGEVAIAIRALLDTGNIVVNRFAVEEGLALLQAGGDFADGVIAYDGSWSGGETFVSFDQKAVKLIAERGYAAQLPA